MSAATLVPGLLMSSSVMPGKLNAPPLLNTGAVLVVTDTFCANSDVLPYRPATPNSRVAVALTTVPGVVTTPVNTTLKSALPLALVVTRVLPKYSRPSP